jgi:4-hydroxy-2-oxoheptanedioate aldolase
MKENKFKKLIKESNPLFGVWNGLPDTYVAEILAGSGFDWILIDAEHAPFDLRTILAQLQTLNQFDVPVLVRPHNGDVDYIKQLLEIGVQNLLVPMVETAEQAELLYKAMQYAPVGIRGVGTALSRAAQWNRTNNYFKEAGEQMCLIVQVENTKGVENLDKILKVDGVDGVFIGPADLAASMGYIGQADRVEVKTVVEQSLKKIRAAGKMAGAMAIAKPLADHYVACGANMVAVAVDTLLLANAAKQVAQSYSKEIQNEVSNTKY